MLADTARVTNVRIIIIIIIIIGTEVGLGPGHIVLAGHPAPPPEKMGHSPQFSAHVCSGQTAGWIKMPLGTKVGLGPAPPKMGVAPHSHPPKMADAYCGQTVAEYLFNVSFKI